MTSYFDASCLLRRLIGDGPTLEPPERWDRSFVSEIARVEVARTLARVESERKLTGDRLATALRGLAELEATLQWVPITESIILLASGPLPTVIKALDAIHLATAIAVRDAGASDLVFATHDRRQATAAAAMGFEVVGV